MHIPKLSELNDVEYACSHACGTLCASSKTMTSSEENKYNGLSIYLNDEKFSPEDNVKIWIVRFVLNYIKLVKKGEHFVN